MIIFLQNIQTGAANPLDWGSSRIRPPAISSLAAEADALNDAFGRTDIVRDVLANLRSNKKKEDIPAELVMDCKSLYAALNSDGVIKDRRSGVAVATLRDTPKSANIQYQWVAGKQNHADHLTKVGTNPQLLLDLLAGRSQLSL